MAQPKITAVESFVTAPSGQRLVVVRVRTDVDGLYGLGCATYTQRYMAVKTAIDDYIGPLVIGREVRDITDIWRVGMQNGYWRNGPVINNAVSGIDMALWDIAGKLADMPCYQLWGGRSRAAVPVYTHSGGRDKHEALDNIRAKVEAGYKFIRCQIGGYKGKGTTPYDDQAFPGTYIDSREKLRSIPEMFEHLRAELGPDPEFIHDVHERLCPTDAVTLAKSLEPYNLFFLEDILAPENIDWLENIRRVCSTPIGLGELFNNPREMLPIIAARQIDFIRCHISQLGGITPALKLAALCEPFGVRTAWHGPLDVSPVGMMANVHIDMTVPNFGIQEWGKRVDAEYDMFPGLITEEGGYVKPTDSPGLGIDFDETVAAKFPPDNANPGWTICRQPDGTQTTP